MRTKILRSTMLALVSVFPLGFGSIPAAAGPAGGAGGTGDAGPRWEARLRADYARLPLRFEVNRGQTDAGVKFLSRGSGYTIFLAPDEAVMVLRSAAAGLRDTPPPAVLRMRMVGASPEPVVSGLDALPGKSNYFIGNDPQKWRTGIPSFAKVRYANVYPGIDLVFHGGQRQLEYDFVVAPGADPEAIRLAWEGAERRELDVRGNLVLHVAGGRVVHHAPVAYQEIDGSRREVRGSYLPWGKDQVGFRVAAYDRSRPLVIDPVLVYSTYLGGSPGDGGEAIAVDGSGNAYVTGWTSSTNFPTASPLQASNAGIPDGFVAKLDAAGSALSYSTYFGGSSDDAGTGIAVDGAGNAYVTGNTFSTDFPTASPLQAANAGGADAIVAKLNAAGSMLSYSTYLGGTGFDFGSGIGVDGSGNAYVTGSTSSTNFPTASPLQAAHGGGTYDGFVAKLDAAGSALSYSTYGGGSSDDVGEGIAVDGAGNAYVTGHTYSTDFPTASPLQAANAGGSDAVVAKLNAAGSVLSYSTYLGGSGYDQAYGIAVDGSGNAYVTGGTSSANFPTASPLQAAHGGGIYDGFVAKLNAAGSGLSYSSYLGGSSGEWGRGIGVDGLGNAYVTGETESTDFPTASPLQASNAGSPDGFVAKLDAAGSGLSYSTYLGGSGGEWSRGIAVDGAGNAYVTGETQSTDFPTANPLQATLAGSTDVFVARLGDTGPAAVPALSGAARILAALLLLSAGLLHRLRASG